MDQSCLGGSRWEREGCLSPTPRWNDVGRRGHAPITSQNPHIGVQKFIPRSRTKKLFPVTVIGFGVVEKDEFTLGFPFGIRRSVRSGRLQLSGENGKVIALECDYRARSCCNAQVSPRENEARKKSLRRT